MTKKSLILYIPVIHKGYLNFLENIRPKVNRVYIISDKFISELYEFEPDIAALPTTKVKTLLKCLGYDKVEVLTKTNVSKVLNTPVLLIQDEVSRNLYEKFLREADVEWKNVFLRWDRDKVLSEEDIDAKVSKSKKDIGFAKEAYLEAEKSSDWWRQVGAVLVKDGKIILRAHNKGMPTDQYPYQKGGIRDYLKAGERQDLSSTIHAEQFIISEAAKKGISTKDCDLYTTHFPCAVCAKLIANSGIKACYFCEGSSNADGKSVLESAKVELTRVIIKS